MVKFGQLFKVEKVRNGLDLFQSVTKNILFYRSFRIHYVAESADWVIKNEALTLKKFVPEINITSSTFGISQKILPMRRLKYKKG